MTENLDHDCSDSCIDRYMRLPLSKNKAISRWRHELCLLFVLSKGRDNVVSASAALFNDRIDFLSLLCLCRDEAHSGIRRSPIIVKGDDSSVSVR